jgi:hypothetical protein
MGKSSQSPLSQRRDNADPIQVHDSPVRIEINSRPDAANVGASALVGHETDDNTHRRTRRTSEDPRSGRPPRLTTR